jgi:hypothetical protein
MNMQQKEDIWDSTTLHEDEVMAIESIEIAAIAWCGGDSQETSPGVLRRHNVTAVGGTKGWR